MLRSMQSDAMKVGLLVTMNAFVGANESQRLLNKRIQQWLFPSKPSVNVNTVPHFLDLVCKLYFFFHLDHTTKFDDSVVFRNLPWIHPLNTLCASSCHKPQCKAFCISIQLERKYLLPHFYRRVNTWFHKYQVLPWPRGVLGRCRNQSVSTRNFSNTRFLWIAYNDGTCELSISVHKCFYECSWWTILSVSLLYADNVQ